MGQENAFFPGALPNMGSPEWLRSIFPSLAGPVVGQGPGPQPSAGMYGSVGNEMAYPQIMGLPMAGGFDPVATNQPLGTKARFPMTDNRLAQMAMAGSMVLDFAPLVTHGWHGSPHTFPPVEGHPLGRFEDKAIGTGEGAQAYGYGHYVAGNQSVAKGYIPPPQTVVTLKGEPLLTVDQSAEDYAHQALRQSLNRTSQPSEPLHPIDWAKASIDEDIFGHKNSIERKIYSPKYAESDAHIEHRRETVAKLNEAKNWLDANRADLAVTQRPGSLYRVEIRPDEHELLDLDKGTKGQLPEIRSKLEELYKSKWNMPLPEYANARDLIGDLEGKMYSESMDAGDYGSRAQLASRALHEAGIPGSKYLDAGSRIPPDVAGIEARIAKAKDWLSKFGGGPKSKFDLSHKDSWELELQLAEKDLAKAGAYKPTRNYVIFHPDNLKVLERNPKK